MRVAGFCFLRAEQWLQTAKRWRAASVGQLRAGVAARTERGTGGRDGPTTTTSRACRLRAGGQESGGIVTRGKYQSLPVGCHRVSDDCQCLPPSANTCHALPHRRGCTAETRSGASNQCERVVASKSMTGLPLWCLSAEPRTFIRSSLADPRPGWGRKTGNRHCHRLPFFESRGDH